jgi:hypothetical protein
VVRPRIGAPFRMPQPDKPERSRFQQRQAREQAVCIIMTCGTESVHGLTHD